MADYISTLTGSQMDAALLDMAEHNSEAYAVGERNGIDVPPDDVTYHNNARYYAQQAQSIAPASVTEAVRWDVAQTALTDANKAQARENIDAGKNGAWTNPNLLDNPWWGSAEAINQRNTTSAPSSNGLYTIDRWIWTTGASGNTWGIGATGITITIASSSVWYSQKNPNPSAINGKTVTGSVLLSDGTIYSGSATFSSGTAAVLYDSTPLRIYLDSGGNFTLRISSTITVRAVKLELGSVSTLANDTPPNYVEELHKCEGYFKYLGDIRWTGYGMALNNSQIRFCISFPKRAKTPTSGIITTPKFYYNNAWTAASSYSVTDYDTSYIMFVINVSQTLTTGSSYLLQADNIQISADL